jgi:hypothetical protein
MSFSNGHEHCNSWVQTTASIEHRQFLRTSEDILQSRAEHPHRRPHSAKAAGPIWHGASSNDLHFANRAEIDAAWPATPELYERRRSTHQNVENKPPPRRGSPSLLLYPPSPSLAFIPQYLKPLLTDRFNRRSRPEWDGPRVHNHSWGQTLSPPRRRGNRDETMECGWSHRPDEADLRVILSCVRA